MRHRNEQFMRCERFFEIFWANPWSVCVY